MVMFSTSLGLMDVRILAVPPGTILLTGTPSITISGSLLALIEVVPRIRIVDVLPGAPLLEVITTPGVFPIRAS